MFRKVLKAKESFPKAFAATNRQQLPKLSTVSVRRNFRMLIGGYIIIYFCSEREISFHIEQFEFDLKRNSPAEYDSNITALSTRETRSRQLRPSLKNQGSKI